MDTPCDNFFVSAYICLVSTRDGTGILGRLFSFVIFSASVPSRGYETPKVFDWAVWDNRDVTSFLLVVNSVVPLCGLLDSIRGASSAVLQGSGCTVCSVNEEHYIHSNIEIFSTNIYTVSINL